PDHLRAARAGPARVLVPPVPREPVRPRGGAETRGRAPRRAAPAARAASPRAGRAPRTERTPRAPGPRGLTSSRDAHGAPGAPGALGAYDDLRFGFPSTRVTRSAYRNPRGGSRGAAESEGQIAWCRHVPARRPWIRRPARVEAPRADRGSQL